MSFLATALGSTGRSGFSRRRLLADAGRLLLLIDPPIDSVPQRIAIVSLDLESLNGMVWGMGFTK